MPKRATPAKLTPGRRPVGPSPAIEPLRPPVSQLGVELFERAVHALQRHQYSEAASTLERLLQLDGADRSLLDRARVYLTLCARHLQESASPLKTHEERVIEATAALNNGDDEGAARLVRAVLEQRPDHDLALYILAAIEARRGESGNAIAQLRRALAVTPELSAQARHDPDFVSLKDLLEFRQLFAELPRSGRLG